MHLQEKALQLFLLQHSVTAESTSAQVEGLKPQLTGSHDVKGSSEKSLTLWLTS